MQPLDGSSLLKVHVSTTENPEEASLFESFEAAHSLHDLSSTIAKKLGFKAPPVRIDSQAKYGALSRGDGAIYSRFPHKGYREKIWDHACWVHCHAAGNPLDFSKGKYLDLETGIIVTNQKLMPLLLKAVKESLEERASSL
ncbi:Inositol monophosphatase family protein [Prunus dulcis]|uniref:Inositol monophosphatase family protein n=1 Tax=Prunus dulcis TaxID=3755 RepID=A0A4Y1RDW3_PRUDU|nr:Inositol monophosphatase family protein [Prunus dulcis]